jgi:hypothetical protein
MVCSPPSLTRTLPQKMDPASIDRLMSRARFSSMLRHWIAVRLKACPRAAYREAKQKQLACVTKFLFLARSVPRGAFARAARP